MRRSFDRATQFSAYGFMAPGLILFSVFMIYPIIQTFIYSFMKKFGTKPSTFIGFENYIRAFNDKIFLISLKNAFLIFIMHALPMIFLALVLAYILNRESTRFRGGIRTMLFMPNVANAVAYTFLFSIILDNDGVLNKFLAIFNISPIIWMSDPFLAKWVISIMIIWRWTGYNMVIFLAGMQSIDKALHEAADMEGANSVQQFFFITVPLLRNTIFFLIIMTINGTLAIFAESQLLAEGGPNFGTYVPALHIYQTAWTQFNFGYASAMSYIVSSITIIIALIQFKIGRKYED